MSQVIFACFKSMVTAHLPASRLPVSNGLPMRNRARDVNSIRYGEKSISDGVPGVCWEPLMRLLGSTAQTSHPVSFWLSLLQKFKPNKFEACKVDVPGRGDCVQGPNDGIANHGISHSRQTERF